MEKISLLKLKEALNKMPNDLLDVYYITHNMWFDELDESPKVEVVFCCDESEVDTYNVLYDNENIKIIQELAKQIDEDVRKVIECEKDNKKIEYYQDDYPI